MFKRKFERGILIAAMLAPIAPLTACDSEFRASMIASASAGELREMYRPISVGERHFDIYRTYRAAFDADGSVAAGDNGASAVCPWHGAISD